MQFILKFLTIIFISNVAFADSKVTEIDFSGDNQVKITLTKPTDVKVFALDNPARLVVDLKNSSLINQTKEIINENTVKEVRNSQSYGKLRLVFDLVNNINIGDVEKLNSPDISRFVIKINVSQINNSKNKETSQNISFSDFIIEKVNQIEEQKDSNKYDLTNLESSKKQQINPISIVEIQKKPIIVIDAGHGGKDPGAIGRYARTKEKNLTLSYSKELKKELDKTGKYEVYLTRKNDNFITLRNRVEIARKRKADLFISLHANSAGSRKISGFSIYTLSENASDKEAEMIAQKENRAEIIKGVDFFGASDDVVKMMISLSQRESMNSSARFAKFLVNSMRNSKIDVLNNTHRFAGFAVLTAPDMISVLIELGYLTNYHEEKKLNSYRYKKKIVDALVNGINQYFAKYK